MFMHLEERMRVNDGDRFDIEGPGLYWGGNQAANADFFAAMVNEAKAMGQSIGVYTSASQWYFILPSLHLPSCFLGHVEDAN